MPSPAPSQRACIGREGEWARDRWWTQTEEEVITRARSGVQVSVAVMTAWMIALARRTLRGPVGV